jgi:hypothetical protein
LQVFSGSGMYFLFVRPYSMTLTSVTLTFIFFFLN